MTPCRWCGRPFEPMTRGGNVKAFCRPKCKGAFETAARRYAYRAVELGLLSVAELKRVSSQDALSPSRAAAGGASADTGVVEVPNA